MTGNWKRFSLIVYLRICPFFVEISVSICVDLVSVEENKDFL